MTGYTMKWITDSLAVGFAPMSHAELASIKTQGINAIVNLCAEFSDLHEIETAAGFEVYYLPVWDEDVPKLTDMEKGLAWLDEAIYLGKKVLVHCRHGIGRTGTFVTSYMIRRGMALKSAEKKLKISNAAPSNYGQWKLLKKYGKTAGTLTLREPSLEIKNRVDLSLFFSDYEALIQKITTAVNPHRTAATSPCGQGEHPCCAQPFDLEFIEVIYLHSTINRHFTSAQRKALIETAMETSKTNAGPCPFNNGSGCKIYDRRPARCRIYGIPQFSADENEIQALLFELSRSLFLAFSGRFMPQTDFKFSVAEAISGKFIQRYFHYLAGLENAT